MIVVDSSNTSDQSKKIKVVLLSVKVRAKLSNGQSGQLPPAPRFGGSAHY